LEEKRRLSDSRFLDSFDGKIKKDLILTRIKSFLSLRSENLVGDLKCVPNE
jgi:hypothetical protein